LDHEKVDTKGGFCKRKMNKKLISVVIANFNGEDYLPSSLQSLLKSSYRNVEVIVVDDGSTDKSVDIISKIMKKDQRVRLLINEENLGAAASRNVALKKSRGDIVVFLDNDTEIEKDTISELVKPLSKKGVGASQAVFLDYKKRDTVQMAGGHLIPQTGWIIPLYQGRSYKKVKSELKEIDIIAISAALAVKKEVLGIIQGFDDKEAVYTEDLDFCWRIWISGYRIVLCPKAIVYHYSRSVEDRIGMKVNYRHIYFHLAKNSFRSISKNLQIQNVFKNLPLSVAINLGRGLIFLISRNDASALIGSTRALIWYLFNLKDTLSERYRVMGYRKYDDEKIGKSVFTTRSLVNIYRGYFLKKQSNYGL